MTTSIYTNGLLRLPREIAGAARILVKAEGTSKRVVFTLVPVYRTAFINFGYKPVKSNARALTANISFRQALVESDLKVADVVGDYEITKPEEDEYVFTVERRNAHVERSGDKGR